MPRPNSALRHLIPPIDVIGKIGFALGVTAETNKQLIKYFLASVGFILWPDKNLTGKTTLAPLSFETENVSARSRHASLRPGNSIAIAPPLRLSRFFEPKEATSGALYVGPTFPTERR